MWTVNTVTNKYAADVSINYVVLSGSSVQTASFPPLGDARTVALNIPYIGIAYFKDIGNTPLGPSKQTYGVLITLNETQWVFRYEGQGALNINVNADGSLSFSSPNGGTIYPINFSGYMRTYNKVDYITAVNGGGLGQGANVPIGTYSRTVGDNELFTLEWVNVSSGIFALKTAKGNYVTAVNGGGIGAGADTNAYPLTTNVSDPGQYELLTIRLQPNGKYIVLTSGGFLWTATNGGGWGESANKYPIHTDAGRLGGWEQFTWILPNPDDSDQI